jgi:hypothetical protein
MIFDWLKDELFVIRIPGKKLTKAAPYLSKLITFEKETTI